MADTGFVIAGTGVNRGFGTTWVNPGNITADDGVNASTVVEDATFNMRLAATNYSFSGLIPAGATIDGMEAQVGDYSLNIVAGTAWLNVFLIRADNTNGIQNKNGSLLSPITANQIDSVGGPADLWGETITRADVIDVDFGFLVEPVNGNPVATLSVDFMAMKIFYTAAAGGSPPKYIRRHIGFQNG